MKMAQRTNAYEQMCVQLDGNRFWNVAHHPLRKYIPAKDTTKIFSMNFASVSVIISTPAQVPASALLVVTPGSLSVSTAPFSLEPDHQQSALHCARLVAAALPTSSCAVRSVCPQAKRPRRSVLKKRQRMSGHDPVLLLPSTNSEKWPS